jgi:hypothetical protein
MKIEYVKIYDEGVIINRAYLGNQMIFNRIPYIYYYSGEVYSGDIYCGERYTTI